MSISSDFLLTHDGSDGCPNRPRLDPRDSRQSAEFRIFHLWRHMKPSDNGGRNNLMSYFTFSLSKGYEYRSSERIFSTILNLTS